MMERCNYQSSSSFDVLKHLDDDHKDQIPSGNDQTRTHERKFWLEFNSQADLSAISTREAIDQEPPEGDESCS